MPMDMPPVPPPVAAYVAPVPECHYLSNSEAQVALGRLQSRLRGTTFSSARPSEICGLVRVEMGSGKVVYTDSTGRYLLLTFALDTHRGEPADTEEQLEQAIDDRSSFPSGFNPGVAEPVYETEAPNQSISNGF